jgi:carbamoyl-phosphate synthase large subunit
VTDKISSVLVPGAAGPAGINTIKSLKLGGYQGSIVATDSSELAAGFFLASSHYVMPEVSHRELYAEKLLALVSRESVQVLMPSSGYDVYAYSELKKELEEKKAFPVVSSRDSLEVCRDKLLTYTSLAHDFKDSLPFTTTDPDKIACFPAMAKPRFGKGSRDVIRIDDEKDMQYVVSKYEEMIFQEFLPGEEFTVDVMSDLKGKPIIAVPRLRLQTKAGISTRGKIIRDAKLESLCKRIVQTIGIIGPSCVQVKASSDGEFKLVEVNPRMGGGTIFTTLAGANFPKMILDMVSGNEITEPTISEITVVRYFDEIIADEGTTDGTTGRGTSMNSMLNRSS